jgi:hypothetical protein
LVLQRGLGEQACYLGQRPERWTEIEDGRFVRMRCHYASQPAAEGLSEPAPGLQLVVLEWRAGEVVQVVLIHLLALSVCKQMKQTKGRTCEAHVRMLQQHRREGAQSRDVACSSAIGLFDRAVWWRRGELGHGLEVAVLGQVPLATYAGHSLTILAVYRGVVSAGAAKACR